MKTLFSGLSIVLFLLVLSCGPKPSAAHDAAKVAFLKQVVEERDFEIVSTWAYPLMTQGMVSIANAGLLMPGSNAGSIDLIGNANHLRVIGDSISMQLPYFGERQMGSGMANINQGIVYDGPPKSYESSWNERKQRYEIKFTVKQGTETLQCFLTLFPSLKSDISINSTHRFSINYGGNMTKPKDDEN